VGKPRLVSHILRAQRKILENELIASFGHTVVITNKDESIDPKRAQQARNSDVYRISIQYTVLGKIHGKEVYLVPPQDVALLLKDQLDKNLWKNLKIHIVVEGLGQFANHTCCDTHWNTNLEVVAIERKEDTHTAPMALLCARCDIEKGTEILTRYWHQDKDAWQNIFDCQCCACAAHRVEDTPISTECAQDTTTITTEFPVQASDIIPWDNTDTQMTTVPHHGRSEELIKTTKMTTQTLRWITWTGMTSKTPHPKES